MSDASEQSLDYETYLKDRELALKRSGEASHALDRTLISLSSGALVVSITLVNKIAGQHPQYSLALFLSWGLFVATIVSTTGSYFTSQKASAAYISVLDTQVDVDVADDRKTAALKDLKRWDGKTRKLNKASFILFCLGITLLAAFAILNAVPRYGYW